MSRRPPKPPPRGPYDIPAQLGKLTLKEASSMDILFLLDATWSMRIHRNVIVEQLEETIKNMVAMFQSSSINVGVVAYRDSKLTPLVEVLKFRELADAEGGGMRDVINWLQNLRFHSGITQDVPEDVHVGLERAASKELGWSSISRAIIHIADAPGHGRRLASRCAPSKYTNDDQPDFDMDGAKLKELLRKLREDRKVNEYAFIHALTTDSQTGMCYKLTDVMVEKMREASADPAWIREFDWCEDDFMNQMYNVASICIQRSSVVTPKTKPEDAPREHLILEEEPDWDDVEIKKVTVEKHQQISSITGLVDMIQANKHLAANVVEEGDLKRAPDPFAQGQSKLVYYGMYRPNRKEEWEKVVLKEFKSRDPQATSGKSYRAQLETLTVASFLAEQFNKHVSELPYPRFDVPEVKFLESTLVCNKYGNKKCFMLKEPWRSEKCVKFNGNNGYINLAEIQLHFQAFSHWTHVVTGEKLMVVDIQGFKVPRTRTSDAEILLTDPAIHCRGETHFKPASGNKNLSVIGPQNFLNSHTSNKYSGDIKICGSLCKNLLPDAVNFRLRQSGGSYRLGNAGEESFGEECHSDDFIFPRPQPARHSFGLQSFQSQTPAPPDRYRSPDPMRPAMFTKNASNGPKNVRPSSTPPVPSMRPSMQDPDVEPTTPKKPKKKKAALKKDPEEEPVQQKQSNSGNSEQENGERGPPPKKENKQPGATTPQGGPVQEPAQKLPSRLDFANSYQQPPTPPPKENRSFSRSPSSSSLPRPEEPQPAPEPKSTREWYPPYPPRSDTPPKRATGQDGEALPLDLFLDLYGVEPPRDDESIATTASIQDRLIHDKNATKIHNLCSKMLTEKGHSTPDYLYKTIELCFELGLITSRARGIWHQRRKLSNVAKHCWNP